MNNKDVYIVQENLGNCAGCGRKGEDLRFGHCFDCAEAESIIGDGTDMYDRDIDGNEVGETNKISAMQKLHFLIKKGWTPPVEATHDRPE